MMKHSTAKRRNYHDICPKWLDTDMFTYQQDTTQDVYSTKTAHGKEHTAIGFSRFVTGDEWTQYIKNLFNVEARQQYLQYMAGS
jgi:hypothetical protein